MTACIGHWYNALFHQQAPFVLGIFHPIAFGSGVPQPPDHVGHDSYVLRLQFLHQLYIPLRTDSRGEVIGIGIVVIDV